VYDVDARAVVKIQYIHRKERESRTERRKLLDWIDVGRERPADYDYDEATK